ncbi:MAG: MFS transporter [Desulfobacteraceae bacterium]|nr:MFS transporter [Desulfobacteraceae bacterium]
MSARFFKISIIRNAVFIFIVCNFFYCYEFFVQVAPGVMVDNLMSDFFTDATWIGILSSSFFWTYTIMQIPAGVLIDRYGARLMLTLASLICTIGTWVFSLAPILFIAIAGRILMGIGSAFAFTGVIYIIIRWFDKRHFAVLIGVLQSIGCIGAIGGESLLSFILKYYMWREIMFCMAIIGFAVTLITWLFIKN